MSSNLKIVLGALGGALLALLLVAAFSGRIWARWAR